MEYIVTSSEMKTCEYNAINKRGVPDLELMENAALAVVEELNKEMFDLSSVLVVCGSGNNGADGLSIARKINADVLLVVNREKASELNLYQESLCKKSNINFISNIQDISKYTTVIDAIFGIGLSRNVDNETSTIIDIINTAKNIVSIDISSGISSDTGKVLGNAVKTNYTITFGYRKLGLLLPTGIEYSGKVILKDIGLSNSDFENATPNISSITYSDLDECLSKRPIYSNKGTFGKVLVIAGSKNMAGAAYFVAKSTLLTGAGLVKIFTPEENRTILQTLIPEALIETDQSKLEECIDWATTVTIGSGIGSSPSSKNILERTLNYSDKPTVLDADALNILSTCNSIYFKKATIRKDLIITPHIVEMARLISKDRSYVTENLLEVAGNFAKDNNCICVLKDTKTIITDDKHTYINQSGNNGMATGGTGDVLTGIITSLIAQGSSPLNASLTGTFIHGLAGDIMAKRKGTRSMIASDLFDGLIEVLKKFN